jgi:hypothetical protein
MFLKSGQKLVQFALLLFASLFLSSLAHAETATTSEMTQICRNWLTWIVSARGDWDGSISPQIINSYDIIDDTLILGRYFEISPNGFVFIPILKEMAPVRAYSETSRLDFSEPGGLSSLVKDVMIARISDFIKTYGSLNIPQSSQPTVLYNPSQRECWNNFLKNDKDFKANLNSRSENAFSAIGPLLTTAWHQRTPYNQLCPFGDSGRQCVVGCVATAAAQILAYHKWPIEGTGMRNYDWYGDASCGGDGIYPPIMLMADFSDSYDWPNIPDQCAEDGPLAQRRALSELCYEVGIAFGMDYGVCGSGTNSVNAISILPNYFRYKNDIIQHLRINNSFSSWATIIHDELQAGRPLLYRIMRHAIVCDGFEEIESLYFYHMNYGWGGNQNAWFVFDDLYCEWEGCATEEEFVLTNIEPDRRVYFSADTTRGDVPFAVNFSGSSSYPTVDKWLWYFGDGDSALTQTPTHIFTRAGAFDITLKVVCGTDSVTYLAENKISAFSDSITGENTRGLRNTIIEVSINGLNTSPLKKVIIPVTLLGNLNLEYLGHSFEGCRTAYFNHFDQPVAELENRRTVFDLENSDFYLPDLPPGYGPLIKLRFSIPDSAQLDQTAIISFDPFLGYSPTFGYNDGSERNIYFSPGQISLAYICGDANHNGKVNLLDVSFIINDLYRGGPDPEEPQAADVNSDGKINLLDISYIINYMYRGGPAPDCTM